MVCIIKNCEEESELVKCRRCHKMYCKTHFRKHKEKCPMRAIVPILNNIKWEQKAYAYGSLHESIKCQLYFLGIQNGYHSVPEYRVGPEDKKRMDMVWLDKHDDIIYAFEIDKRWNETSVERFGYIECRNKIILSYTNRTSRNNRDKRLDKKNIHQYFVKIRELW